MKKVYSLLVIIFFAANLIAQNVGINNIDPKVALDVNGGFRLRSENATVSGTSVMLNSNRSHHVLIGSPTGDFNIAFIGATEDGQHVIITNNTMFRGFLVPIYIQPNTTVELIYSGAAWKQIGSNEAVSKTAWSRTGNGGTIDGVNNLFGTTDFKPIRFIENGQPAGYMDASSGNYFFGNAAGNSMQAIGNTTGSDNTAVGSYALVSDTATIGTVAIGAGALFYNQARLGNTAVGSDALFFNTFTNSTPILATQGLHNTALGNSALTSNRRGSGGVAIGYKAAFSDTAADGMVAIGRNALYSNNGKPNNLAIGDSVLYYNSIGAAASYQSTNNIGIGSKALLENTTGFNNIAIGKGSLTSSTGGFNNIAIGTQSMSYLNNGFDNIGIGNNSLIRLIEGSGNISMGNLGTGIQKGTNNILFGNTLTTPGNTNVTDSGADNVMIGYKTSFRLGGHKNIYIGSAAGGLGVKSSNNVGIGDSALSANSFGYSNVAMGAKALAKNTVKSNLVAVGDSALFNNGIGVTNIDEAIGNTAIGSKALYKNEIGSFNTALGTGSLNNRISGDENTAIGTSALAGGSSGNSNTGIGRSALQNTNGSLNTGLGLLAMWRHQTGTENLALGPNSLSNNLSGTGNVALGANSAFNELGSNKLYIENSNANKDNALIYGDFAADSLLLNAKTVVKNNAVVRGFTKLGGYETDVPSIKTKKLVVTSSASSTGFSSINHGLTASKILSVTTLLEWTPGFFAPTEYSPDPLLRYNYFISPTQITIQNNAATCAYICSKQVKIMITYEE